MPEFNAPGKGLIPVATGGVRSEAVGRHAPLLSFATSSTAWRTVRATMPRRLTNDLLLALVLSQVLGGVLGWALPVEQARPLYDLHRALGIGIILLLGWKYGIALASLRRRVRRRSGWDRSILWGSLAGIGLLTTLGIGVAWTLNLISFDLLWGYSPLNIHVFIGIGLVP